MTDDELDRALLDELVEALGPDAGMVLGDLLSSYRQQSAELLAQADAAVAAGDRAALRRAAHQLKGSSASVGAPGVARIADLLEHSDAPMTSLGDDVARCRAAIESVLPRLQQLADGMAAD